MTRKILKMSFSEQGYNNFKWAMKKLRFSDEEEFMKYCALNMIKTVADTSDKRLITKEMNMIKDKQKSR